MVSSGTVEIEMIETKNLNKRYGSFKALSDVSLRVESGEIYSLLGSNGAGKTTIIKIITGLLEATSGYACIDGLEARKSIEVKKRIGYMPEQPHLYDRLTGREFLEMMGSLRNLDEDILKSKVDSFAAEMEIDHVIDSEMGSYSKGMKQKVLFANAILHNPPNLILDEPTSGLDPRFTRYIKDRICELAERGKTVLMSTHITEVAAEISDRIAIIDRGRIIAEGSVMDLMERTGTKTLEHVFVEVIKHERNNH